VEIEKIVQYWLTTAAGDLMAAEHLLQSGDYPHALFFAHLYLEKVLKARIVRESGEHAPFSHKLRYLAEKAQLNLTSEQAAFLVRVTEYSTRSRYPDMEMGFKRQCTREFCAAELAQVKEFGSWIEKMVS
jgi:HEPN domain-containing protein